MNRAMYRVIKKIESLKESYEKATEDNKKELPESYNELNNSRSRLVLLEARKRYKRNLYKSIRYYTKKLEGLKATLKVEGRVLTEVEELEKAYINDCNFKLVIDEIVFYYRCSIKKDYYLNEDNIFFANGKKVTRIKKEHRYLVEFFEKNIRKGEVLETIRISYYLENDDYELE